MIKTEDLIKRIEKLKAERERTADCLKEIEAELERRKREVQLGVPFVPKSNETYWYVTERGSVYGLVNEHTTVNCDTMEFLGSFCSKESAEKHAEMLLAWRKALVANANGEQIDIKVLLPFMRKGWVAMDEDKDWFWYECKPCRGISLWNSTQGKFQQMLLFLFNIKPVENWRESLMECGL